MEHPFGGHPNDVPPDQGDLLSESGEVSPEEELPGEAPQGEESPARHEAEPDHAGHEGEDPDAREAARRRATEKVRTTATQEELGLGGEVSPSAPVPSSRKGERTSTVSRSREEESPPSLTVGGGPLAYARHLVEEGKVEEAIELYREVVSDHPQSLKARNNLGVLYDEMGQHEMALEQFEAARAIDPDNVEVLGNLGSALLGLNRFEDAERELRKGLRIDPESLEARASLGILHFRRGLYAQAETELRWVSERDHDHAAAHFYRGEALNRLGKVDEAIEALERVVRLQPRNAKAYYTLGILFDKKHLPYEAGQMYRKARELAK